MFLTHLAPHITKWAHYNNYINSLRLVTKLLFSQLGSTPLHLAVYYNQSEVVEQLLLFHANMNIENNVSSAISSVRVLKGS